MSFVDVVVGDGDVDVVLLFNVEYEVDGRRLCSSDTDTDWFASNISNMEGVFLSPKVLMAVAIARDSTNNSSEF